MKWKPLSFVGVVLAATGIMATDALAQWPSAGADLNNSRYQTQPSNITSSTVSNLQLKWTRPTAGDVTAHPAVDGNYLYFPDSAGFLYKVDKTSGALVWQRPISDYTGIAGDIARGTPAVAGNLLILGNLNGRNIQLFGAPAPAPMPARVFAVDKNTGAPVWSTRVDKTAYAFVTNSPIVYNGTAFVGVASNEELISAFVAPANWKWTFRGSVVALDVKTGDIKWQTYTVPNNGYYGASVWGSTGAVDTQNNLLFITTGNNLAAPQKDLNCILSGTPAAQCINPDDHFDSIIALNMSSGVIKWGQKGVPYDVWNVACGLLTIPGLPITQGMPYSPGAFGNCPNGNPQTAGPDYDFAQGPMLFGNGLVGAGQKSGMFWAFDRKTGALAWNTQAAPGGVTGGLQWGSATDGTRVFFAASNSGPPTGGGGQSWPQVNGPPVTSGGWGALDNSGQPLWTTPDPVNSRSEAPVSGVNDVVFGCNLVGTMVAMNAQNGNILWMYSSGAPCNAGASISADMVYWGSGTFAGNGTKQLFAFGLP